MEETAELEDELQFALISESHCRRRGLKLNRPTVLLLVTPAHLAFPTQFGKTEFHKLSPSASVRAGPDVSPPRVLVKVGLGTSPRTVSQ